MNGQSGLQSATISKLLVKDARILVVGADAAKINDSNTVYKSPTLKWWGVLCAFTNIHTNVKKCRTNCRRESSSSWCSVVRISTINLNNCEHFRKSCLTFCCIFLPNRLKEKHPTNGINSFIHAQLRNVRTPHTVLCTCTYVYLYAAYSYGQVAKIKSTTASVRGSGYFVSK